MGALPDTTLPRQEVSTGLRIAAIALRSIFGCALVAVVIRVSLPQNESIWSVYDTPADLVRVALGLLVCLWIVFHLFMLPKDADGYRTWVYLGLALVPLAIACVIAVW
jgi:hypothetical protein